MPWNQEILWCGTCGKETPHTQKPPNHAVHLLLSLATLGVWIIPWIWLSVKQDRPRCDDCGTYFASRLTSESLEDDGPD